MGHTSRWGLNSAPLGLSSTAYFHCTSPQAPQAPPSSPLLLKAHRTATPSDTSDIIRFVLGAASCDSPHPPGINSGGVVLFKCLLMHLILWVTLSTLFLSPLVKGSGIWLLDLSPMLAEGPLYFLFP